MEEMRNHPEARSAQKVLAAEVVTFMHGKDALKTAMDVTDALFSGRFEALDSSAFKMLEQTLETVRIKGSKAIIDLLVESNLAQSNREARTFITQGAVAINDQKVDAFDHVVDQSQTYHDTYVVIRRGKKKYALGVFER